MHPGSRYRTSVRGYSYVLLLLCVALISIAATGSVRMGAALQRQAAESALLEVGQDLREALSAYHAVGTGPQRCPVELRDLLRDPRVPTPRRYLRAIPIDPLTGSPEWGIRRNRTGSITALYSLAPGRPVKRTGFPAGMASAGNASSYAAWQFGDCGAD